MSLENVVQELTAAIVAQTVALEAHTKALLGAPIGSKTVAAEEKTPPPAKPAAEKAVKEKPKAEPELEIIILGSPTPEPEVDSTDDVSGVLPAGERNEKFYDEHIKPTLVSLIKKDSKEGTSQARTIIGSYTDASTGKPAANFKVIPSSSWEEAFTRMVAALGEESLV